MLFGLLISSPRNVWVCGSKVLGHFNTVIIIIIEIKQHSSLGRRAPWTFFFFFVGVTQTLFGFSFINFVCYFFANLLGVSRSSFLVVSGVSGFSFLFYATLCATFGPRKCVALRLPL